jgi:hypothetical protein
MFHKNIKLIIAGLLVITGIWQFTENNIGNGFSLLLLTAIPIFLYFKNEFILLAFLKLRKQDFEGAKNGWYSLKPRNCLSAQTTRVLQLPWNHAVTNNINQSEKYFKKAIELGCLWTWI